MSSGTTSRMLIVALSVLAGAATCSAGETTVGEVKIAIPDPPGFAPVTPEMEPLYKLTKQLVAASNQEFLSFIPVSEVEAALQGQVPNLTRRFSVQGYRQLIPVMVSTADFEKIKVALKDENKKTFDKVRAQLPDLTDQINQGLAKELDINMAFSISSFIPSPAHLDTPQLFAFSALTQYEFHDDAGKAVQESVAGTTTFALVRGKLLYLYCYADKSDMEWTKEISRQWAEAVLAANPGEPEPRDALSTLIRRIDLGTAGLSGLVGAVVAIIVVLAKNRAKKRQSPAN
jgi:hypothetical protein